MVFPVLLENRALRRVLFFQLVDNAGLFLNGLGLHVGIGLKFTHRFVGKETVDRAEGPS